MHQSQSGASFHPNGKPRRLYLDPQTVFREISISIELKVLESGWRVGIVCDVSDNLDNGMCWWLAVSLLLP